MNTPTTTNTTGSELVAAVETFWSAIAARHPELPARVVAITGSGKVRGGLILGHWAAGAWTADTARLPELFVSGENMARGGFYVATTLLHEAAHALLQARGDITGGTSRQGRYHTKSGFGAAAVEMGLTPPATPDATLGFSACTMPDDTAIVYAAEIMLLDAALTARIATITTAELCAAAIAVGAILGGLNVIVPWWITDDAATLWGSLGGTIKTPRAPRKPARIKVELTCGCRSIKVWDNEAADFIDLSCARCHCALVSLG